MTKKQKYVRLAVVLISLVALGLIGFYVYRKVNIKPVKQETVEDIRVQAKVPEYIVKQDVIDVMEKAKVDLIKEAGGREPDSGAIRLAQLQKAHEFIKDTYREEIHKRISPSEEEINAELDELKKDNPDVSEDILKEMAKERVINKSIDNYIAFLLDTISKEVK